MDKKRFYAVAFLDIGFRHAWLEVEDCIGIEFEGFEDAVDFGVLCLGVS